MRKRYIKEFNTVSDYNTFKTSASYYSPNVSYISNTDVILYNPTIIYPQIPLLRNVKNYLSFVAQTSGTFQFSSAVDYSVDNGITWSTLASNTASPTVAAGSKIMWKATLTSTSNGIGRFSSTSNFTAEGNIMSLLYGDNSVGQTSLEGKAYAFCELFRSCTKLVKAPELPSTVLGKEAYSSMFESCTSLAYPPSQLKFTSVQPDSYNRMFCMSRSSKLTTPAMTYTPKMFGNWGSVNPATSNMQMFCGNGNLTNIYCYWTNTSGTFGNIANWVNYTADSGVTFYKRSTQSFASGVNGIKTGWTVVNDDTTQPT